jgi:hypothetical protein
MGALPEAALDDRVCGITSGTRCTLSDSDLRYCQEIASSRYLSARAHHAVNQLRDDASSAEFDGVCAELAFARLAGVDPILSPKRVRGSADCILHDGQRVDVKHTRHDDGMLLAWGIHTNRGVDLFVLMTGTPPRLTFRGYAATADLIDVANIRNLGKGDCYALEQDRIERCLIWFLRPTS